MKRSPNPRGAELFTALLKQYERSLYGWQRRWMRDRSKFKVALKARQLGYTTVMLLEALLEALKWDGLDVYLVSTTVRSASRLLRLLRRTWLRALQESGEPAVQLVNESKTEIEFPNGARIIAVANEPELLRGNVGSYFFDEFAFWERRKLTALEGAIWPTIINPLNPHLVCRIVSTPWFADNMYHDVCHAEQYSYFSRHVTDIYQAVKEGFPFDIEAERRKLTSDRWEREYLLKFLTGGASYFSRDALLQLDADDEPMPARELVEIFFGVDLAKIQDFTSVVVLARGDFGMRVLRTYMMRSIDYGQQARILGELADHWRPEGIAVDITKHASFVDQLDEKLRRRCIGQNFTSQWKAEWVPRIKQDIEEAELSFRFEDAQLWDQAAGGFVATPSRIILDDLARVIQSASPSGKAKFEVPRQKMAGAEAVEGHGDSFSALLLAYWLAWAEEGWGEQVVKRVELGDGLPPWMERLELDFDDPFKTGW